MSDCLTDSIDGRIITSPVDGTDSSTQRGKWERCVQCGLSFPRIKMRVFRGAWYGVPCGDYKDIKSIIRNELASRHVRYDKRSGSVDY